MNRISIQTTIIDGKKHVTVYLSDGITITERAGTSVIRTMVRTFLAHRWAQYKIRKQITATFAPNNVLFVTKPNSTSLTYSTTPPTIPQTSSARIIRFMSRVDRIERKPAQ